MIMDLGKTLNLLNYLNDNKKFWLYEYVKWELIFLSELGYGLDLTACVVTGEKENLAFVSPKSGRAVSVKGAGKWKNKLFPLPNFLINDKKILDDKNELSKGVLITSFFLNRYVSSLGLKLPDVRDRFTNKLHKL